ncbi:MerR family transcriptional regulator [Schaalia sp. 19OD2882]|uniref:transcriptional regulator FtsR n=1 Tax=Schaalia sp. 19OD2882 TaxID=2794089 RepID=UPI001C1EE94F|nr:MerR family transcriptional regulator [Schaalia sp. 19OD2882]QWW18680.1 MerR family transcriptional regulator [Schaalia sp. 19OD2882]
MTTRDAAARELAGAQEDVALVPWPRGVSRKASLTIGQVVETLAKEFPAITVSKVRYLEDQELVSPTRTASGYRKYSPADVARLRFVLQRQRDTFAPLRVIGDELRALDAGHEPAPSRSARVVASEGRVVDVGNRPAVPASDLCDLTGADLETLERFTRLGLVTPDLAGYFPSRCIQVVSLLLQLEGCGIDVRTLRAVRTGAERSADIIDQTVTSQHSRRRAGDAERAAARSAELGELFADLHREMLRVSLHNLNRR